MDQVLAFDERLYLAILSERNTVIAFAAVAFVVANFQGLMWWVFGLGLMRRRGFGRRGAWIALTVFSGLGIAWSAAELLKLVVQRPRPFLAILIAPPTLIAHPSGYSFPSGDTALAFGAAVALGHVLPRLRPFALLLAIGVGLSRLVSGVHYPLDVAGGVVVGVAGGLAAPWVVARIRRAVSWRVFVVPHTHWDREWYERFEGFRARLVPMVGSLLDLLEREPRFTAFTFDGQTIPLEDHLAVRPEDRPRIAALVRADRLIIGPWYVLADLLLVSGESLVRNLQEGLRVSASFGRSARVVYAADPFGHPAQLPQVLRGFGYDAYVFARGVGDEGEELGSEFRWEAPSGDRVLASHQVAHYNNALPLVVAPGRPAGDHSGRVRRELPRILDRTTPYASGDALLFMVGDDHQAPFADLPDVVDAIPRVAQRISARIATLEEFVAALPAPRGVFAGEMVSGRYRPILRGVNSTRVWLKQQNAACERLLVERCEVLDALAGGPFVDRLRELWRTLIQNHPHDSICGCSIDAVHDLDMRPRFARVRDEGERLATELTARLSGSGASPIVWSALPWPRHAVVPLGTRPTVVTCGGIGAAAAVRASTGGVSAPAAGVIENERFRVEVAEDGSFQIIDRASGTCSGRLNLFIDEGDRGDEYTYSYAGPTVGTKGLAGRCATRVDGDRAQVTVELTLRLPSSLRDDRLARVVETVDCRIRTVIALDASSSRVDVTTTIVNPARDHRLKVVHETGVRSVTHTAGAAFAWLERANPVPRKRGWVEPPTAERCFHELVAVGVGSAGLAVGADGLRDYSVLADGGAIVLTLIRSVGWLSRADLPERRGGAGPQIETPSAQCLGEHAFRYCLIPLGGEVGIARAARLVREFLSPPWLATGSPTADSYCRIEGDEAVTLSALRGRSADLVVLRLVNPGQPVARALLRFDRPVVSARSVDLREGETSLGNTGLDVLRTAAPLELVDGAAQVTLEAFEIGTWEIAFA
ncbi:MAG TPA: phosphatase PAP2 family protein [Candidatus Limnocylindria bacterium]|nr:phosphatase PAP2 family protein [Candidatus Limnocylindria bacterium]